MAARDRRRRLHAIAIPSINPGLIRSHPSGPSLAPTRQPQPPPLSFGPPLRPPPLPPAPAPELAEVASLAPAPVELLTSAPEARCRGARGDLEQSGNLRRGHLLQLEEDEDFPQLLGHGREHLVEQRAEALLIGELVGLRIEAEGLEALLFGHLAAPSQRAPRGAGHAERRPEQERSLAADRDGREPPRGHDEDLLQAVGELRGGTRVRARERQISWKCSVTMAARRAFSAAVEAPGAESSSVQKASRNMVGSWIDVTGSLLDESCAWVDPPWMMMAGPGLIDHKKRRAPSRRLPAPPATSPRRSPAACSTRLSLEDLIDAPLRRRQRSRGAAPEEPGGVELIDHRILNGPLILDRWQRPSDARGIEVIGPVRQGAELLALDARAGVSRVPSRRGPVSGCKRVTKSGARHERIAGERALSSR